VGILAGRALAEGRKPKKGAGGGTFEWPMKQGGSPVLGAPPNGGGRMRPDISRGERGKKMNVEIDGESRSLEKGKGARSPTQNRRVERKT